jgi:hypothetical protein
VGICSSLVFLRSCMSDSSDSTCALRVFGGEKGVKSSADISSQERSRPEILIVQTVRKHECRGSVNVDGTDMVTVAS